MKIRNVQILQLVDTTGSVLRQCTLSGNNHKEKLLEVWRKLYGKGFDKCTVKIIDNEYATYKKPIK